MKSLETERLRLRLFENDDMGIHEVVFSDPEVCRHYCKNTRTPEETREWLIHRKWQARDGLGFLAVLRKEDCRIIGLVALQLCVADWLALDENPESPYPPFIVELSYAFGRDYHRQGYATEACRALIDYGFKEVRLPRLVNGISMENEPSIRLAERLGFQREINVKEQYPIWILDNKLI
jgi:RimJ/RimL family protein N-acetyltransferase